MGVFVEFHASLGIAFGEGSIEYRDPPIGADGAFAVAVSGVPPGSAGCPVPGRDRIVPARSEVCAPT